MKWLILNPSRPLPEIWREVAEGKTPGWQVRRSDRTRRDSTQRHVREALSAGADTLFLAGGDGTLHRCVNEIHRRMGGRWRRAPAVGLIPAGTCNDLWRRLRAAPFFARPPKPGGPWREILLDLGRIRTDRGGRLFVNNAGCGRDRLSIQRGDGPIRTIFRMAPFAFREGNRRARAMMILACNGPYFSGGLRFDGGVDPSDGRLEMFAVPPKPALALAGRLLLGRLGMPLLNGSVLRRKFRRIRLLLERPGPVQADGEDLGDSRLLEMEALPGRLRLLVG